jgi:plastocyanin
MRKLLVLGLFGALTLVLVGSAVGKVTKTVTISKTGYTPNAVTVTTEDAVVFKNTDSNAHTVVFSPTTGVNCGGTLPLVVPAGQGVSCSFSSGGKYRFSDAASKKKAFKGTITVTPPLVSNLTVTPKTITYGRTSTIAGTIAGGQSGQAVQITAEACKAAPTSVATVTTTAGGAFSYQARPSNNTLYTLSSNGLTSSTMVGVKPRMHLAKVAAHRYQVKVYAAHNLLGARVTFQRYKSSVKRWVAVKVVRMHTSATKGQTVLTSAKFRSSIRAHKRVRASLGARQVSPCYSPARSNTIRS